MSYSYDDGAVIYVYHHCPSSMSETYPVPNSSTRTLLACLQRHDLPALASIEI